MNIYLGGMRPGLWRLLSKQEMKDLLRSLDARDSSAVTSEE